MAFEMYKMEDQIRNLIAQNKLTEAIEILRSSLNAQSQKNALIVIENRWNDLKEKRINGTISTEHSNIEQNKICNSLLALLDSKENPTSGLLKSNKRMYMILGGVLLIAAAIFGISLSKTEKCTDSKIAILIADFIAGKEEHVTEDPFANSLAIEMDALLSENFYDVRPVGPQTRNIERYNDAIQEKYYDKFCDTSGVFINGLLDKGKAVFNMYTTIVNLKMQSADFSDKESLVLANPQGITFSIPDDAKFLADFFVAMVKSYEGKHFEALKDFDKLIMNDTSGFMKNESFAATLAHYKGNCYALRGDNVRAKKQYEIVRQQGSPELKETVDQNEETADEINKRMREDPEQQETLQKNIRTHSQLEKDLDKFFKSIGRGVEKIWKDVFKK